MFGNRNLRRLSGITLFFFLWMTLYPAVSAAAAPTPARPATTPATKAAANPLEDLRDTAQRARVKAERNEDNSPEETQLLQHAERLDTEQREAEADFAAIGRHLDAHHLPAEIKQRHAQAVADYRAKMQQLKQHLKDFKTAHQRRDKSSAQRQLKELANFLNKEQKHRQHQPFDPKNLPFSTPSDKVRAPKETKEDLDKLIQTQATPLQVAASELTAGMLAPPTVQATASPQSEDLAPTEDVQITDEIKALARRLNNNPVEIYNWVRNNIEFIPTYGSIQGSQLDIFPK